MLKFPAIAQVERDTIGQMDARFGRVARSLGIEVCGCTTLDGFFSQKFSALRARLCEAVPYRVEKSPR